MHKILFLSLTGLLLAGCGNDASLTATGTNTTTGSATVAPLAITAQNAPILGSSMRDVLNGSGALDDEVAPGSSLTFIQAVSWASVVQEMFNAYPLFVQGSSRVVPGPAGGIAQVTQSVQGDGAIRRTVVAPNVIRTEVQLPGTSTFTPLQ